MYLDPLTGPVDDYLPLTCILMYCLYVNCMFSCIVIVTPTFIVSLPLLLCTYRIAFTLMPYSYISGK